MASQYMNFSVRGVGGGRGPTARPYVNISGPHVRVLQSYADYIAMKKKKKKEEDSDS